MIFKHISLPPKQNIPDPWQILYRSIGLKINVVKSLAILDYASFVPPREDLSFEFRVGLFLTRILVFVAVEDPSLNSCPQGQTNRESS